MEEKNLPTISVVVATRNRGVLPVATVQSILLNDYPHFEMIVVDQSTIDLTATAIAPLTSDPRLHFLPTATHGLGEARNLGISQASGEIIAITDDDCQVPTHWLKELVAAFSQDSRIGIVFGNVFPGEYNAAAGFISSYIRRDSCLARSIGDKHKVEGMGACMGLRRSVWHSLHGFDPMLGAGSRLKSAEDTDFVIRTLLAGYYVYETPKLFVTHHGFRTWVEGRPLIRGYMFGLGAMLVKQLRCGHWPVLQVFFRLAWRWAFAEPVINFGYCPPRFARLTSFIQGCFAGFLCPINKAKGHYSFRK